VRRTSNHTLIFFASALLLLLLLPILALPQPLHSECLELLNAASRSENSNNSSAKPIKLEACLSWQTAGWENEPAQPLVEEVTPSQANQPLTQGDLEAAIAAWRQIIALSPQDAHAQYQLGLLLAAQVPQAALPHLAKAADLDAQYAKSVSNLRRAISGAQIADDLAYTLLSSGRALASIDEWRLAAEAFRNAILNDPGYAEAWAYLGEARQHLLVPEDGNLAPGGSDGLIEIETAIDLDPNSVAAQTFLALYWLRRQEYLPALEAIQRSIALAPDHPVLIAQLAEIQAASGDIQGAYQTYQQAAALAPYDPDYQRQILRFSLDYNFQVEQIALPIARQRLVEDPHSAIDLDLMSQVLIHLGDLLNAERFITRALQIDPEFSPAYLHLGLIYLLKDEPQIARFYLEKARDLQPNTPTAVQAERLLESVAP